ncbi:MAG: hypothetical protein HYZ50_19710 [Deltaproteobacteria bacterium]|nr:hypothetical protein [Deltaproteobacteria bacterium]
MIELSGGPFQRKIQLEADLLLEVDIRVVRASRNYPEGVRYRCYLGNPNTREVIVLYDIHSGKPHHRQVRGREEPYRFTTPEQLWDDFVTDVEAVLRGEL